MPFDYSRLRRWPDVEAPNLQAWDATDEQLVARALEHGAPGDEIAVIGDEYGAISLALAEAGLTGIRVHQDLASGRRALARNAAERGIVVRENGDDPDAAGRVADEHAVSAADGPGFPAIRTHELDARLLAGARLVLLQLPKALAELDEIVDAVARWAAPDATLIAGGRVKHMTLAQNDLIGGYFGSVQPQRAERKSRLVVASDLRRPDGPPPFPVRRAHPEFRLTLVAHGGAFAGDRIDIGTRVLLEVLRERTVAGVVVDLGCGTGALAAFAALRAPDAQITATDRSAAAVASARATMAANGIAERVTVTHDDAGGAIADASADVVLLNPPFHLGASVHTGAATRLFEAAARILKPGGELLTVFNSSLAYRSELTRLIGSTQQLRRTSKFTVTCSIRRS